MRQQVDVETQQELDRKTKYAKTQDGKSFAIKSGDVDAIRHDPHFLYFVVRYKQLYDKTLDYLEAIELYRRYDIEWLNEIAEYEQLLQFVRDTATREALIGGR